MMAVSSEWFKKNCPNIYGAIHSNIQQYYIYGIPFKSHSIVKWYDIQHMAESQNCRVYFFAFKWIDNSKGFTGAQYFIAN